MAERLTKEREFGIRAGLHNWRTGESGPSRIVVVIELLSEIDELRSELAASEQQRDLGAQAYLGVCKQLTERDSRIAELEESLGREDTRARDAEDTALKYWHQQIGELAPHCSGTRQVVEHIKREKVQLQAAVERLTVALQRLVKTCPCGCSDGKIGNAESSYMECPACGPLRQALSAPSAQQAQQRIAAMEELEKTVYAIQTRNSVAVSLDLLEAHYSALQRWRETR